ncbi:hypothetical protein AB4Z48_29650 [Cupriavidus sp. 2TAF22]|uniref:c-type cytochrome n=1 Tax=unclassified Cupriavidus TaxID=2640874 RepID=UPI003F927554
MTSIPASSARRPAPCPGAAARGHGIRKQAAATLAGGAWLAAGPAYREAAAKYEGMDPAMLAASIQARKKGKRGQPEMPPRPGLSDAAARVLARQVPDGSPDK